MPAQATPPSATKTLNLSFNYTSTFEKNSYFLIALKQNSRMRKMLKNSSSSISSVCLGLDLCNPARSKKPLPVERTTSAHSIPDLHWICSQSSREQMGKRFLFGTEVVWKDFSFKTTQKIFSDQNRNLHSQKRLPGHTQNKKKMDKFSIAGRLIVVRTQHCNLLMKLLFQQCSELVFLMPKDQVQPLKQSWRKPCKETAKENPTTPQGRNSYKVFLERI